jgi:hypothetical protein
MEQSFIISEEKSKNLQKITIEIVHEAKEKNMLRYNF